MRGFLNIDKPAGVTSFDVVRAVRRASGVRRVGHAGTLDPMATGVLPVAVGDATRLVDALVGARKRYVGEVTLGVETDTDDADGEVTAHAGSAAVAAIDTAAIEAALAAFEGEHEQLPPAYSAIKRAGVPAYRAARRGEAQPLDPRPVVAYRLTLLAHEGDRVTIDVECGKGFYVRSLARDLGRVLGVGAHLSALRRTAVGAFTVERAVALDQACARLERGDADDVATLLHAPDVVLASWPAIVLGGATVEELRLGRTVAPEPLRAPSEGRSQARAYGPDGRLVALVEAVEGRAWHPYRVFAG